MFISADKTQKFYEIENEDHEKILFENVTKTYKKQTLRYQRSQYRIKKDCQRVKQLNIMAKQQCFVTIKDHRPDFRTNPKYRLLNPTKSELGKLSKHILQTINTELQNKLKVNQW